MKLQDQYKFESTLLGLLGIYHIVGEDSRFLNSECGLLTNHIINRRNASPIVDKPKGTDVKVSPVNLLDVYYQEGVIHLIVQDIITQRIITIDQCLQCPETHCTWVLIDLNY